MKKIINWFKNLKWLSVQKSFLKANSRGQFKKNDTCVLFWKKYMETANFSKIIFEENTKNEINKKIENEIDYLFLEKQLSERVDYTDGYVPVYVRNEKTNPLEQTNERLKKLDLQNLD